MVDERCMPIPMPDADAADAMHHHGGDHSHSPAAAGDLTARRIG